MITPKTPYRADHGAARVHCRLIIRYGPGISPDQQPAPQVAGQLRQGEPGGLDLIGTPVAPGVARRNMIVSDPSDPSAP
jgi:hypothetical protein